MNDSLTLRGKTVLITGGAKRVGAEMARALHGAGANVVVHYHRSAEVASVLVGELNAARRHSAVATACDLLDVSRFATLIDTATQNFGHLDVLINNASTFYPTPVGEITTTQWDDLIGSNLKAPLFLTQAAAMALRLTKGLVLNIADIHGQRPLRRYPVYSVAKAGLIMLTRSMARELGPHIRVNAIAPGPVMWPADGTDKALQEKIINRTALKRSGSAQDIARAALFFCTAAPYVTGQILAVDGGRSIGW